MVHVDHRVSDQAPDLPLKKKFVSFKQIVVKIKIV